MNRCLLTILTIATAIVLNSCREDATIVLPPNGRTLVILADYSAGSEAALQMLGAVRKAYPEVTVEFITTKAFDVAEAGFLLDVAVSQYPDGTAFLVEVEPGSVTKRIVFQIGTSRVFVPDNGLASRVFDSHGRVNCWYAENPNLLGGDPAVIPDEAVHRAAALSILSDVPLPQFGPACPAPVTIPVRHATAVGDTVTGEILYTDDFGNCVSNIPDSLVRFFATGDVVRATTPSGTFLLRMGTTYSSVPMGENVVFVSGSHRLEFAVDYGNISQRYGIGSGTPISIVKAKPIVGILRYNASSVTDDLLATIRDRLAAAGLQAGVNITFIERNANGDMAAFPGLAAQLVTGGADVVLAIATPAAQAAVRYLPERIPVVFTYVTAPENAGLFSSRTNVCGLSDALNFDAYLGFIKGLMPNLVLAGRIYNSLESNSQFAQDQLNSYAPAYGLSFAVATVTSESQIPQQYAVVRAAGPGAVITAVDNTMNKGMRTLAALAIADRLPLFGTSKDNVADGALAGLSIDIHALGRGTGDYLSHVLFGRPTTELPVQRFPTNVISLNTATAAAIGFTFPQAVVQAATNIYP